jgi:hypothetical protein
MLGSHYSKLNFQQHLLDPKADLKLSSTQLSACDVCG